MARSRDHGGPELAYLEAGWPLMSLDVLTAGFNGYFGTTKTEKQIKATLSNHRIRCGRSTGSREFRGNSDIFTIEQIEFIRILYWDFTAAEVAQFVREHYKIPCSTQRIKTFTTNKKIKSRVTGYEKGNVPWQAGKAGTGLCKPNSGSFFPGHARTEIKPLGSERVDKKGYIWVKTDEWDPNFHRIGRWRLKHQLVWEKHNGKIPKGMVLWFKDSNPQNCAIENLEIITRLLQLRLNKMSYSSLDPELQPAMRKTCELQVAIAIAKNRK